MTRMVLISASWLLSLSCVSSSPEHSGESAVGTAMSAENVRVQVDAAVGKMIATGRRMTFFESGAGGTIEGDVTVTLAQPSELELSGDRLEFDFETKKLSLRGNVVSTFTVQLNEAVK